MVLYPLADDYHAPAPYPPDDDPNTPPHHASHLEDTAAEYPHSDTEAAMAISRPPPLLHHNPPPPSPMPGAVVVCAVSEAERMDRAFYCFDLVPIGPLGFGTFRCLLLPMIGWRSRRVRLGGCDRWLVGCGVGGLGGDLGRGGVGTTFGGEVVVSLHAVAGIYLTERAGTKDCVVRVVV